MNLHIIALFIRSRSHSRYIPVHRAVRNTTSPFDILIHDAERVLLVIQERLRGWRVDLPHIPTPIPIVNAVNPLATS